MENISLENILVVLRSIAQDKMEPNETLVHSRLKEYFGLKVSMKDWKKFILTVYEDSLFQQRLNKFKHIVGSLDASLCENGNLLLVPGDYSWEFADIREVDEAEPIYQAFLECMNHFFAKPSGEDFRFLNKDPSRWNFTRSSSYNTTAKQNLLKLMKLKGISKAIPGGKYGCALMLKQLYEKEFGQVPLGEIIALIKKSLKVQDFLHFKTLIMKNEAKGRLGDEKRRELISQAESLTIQLLEESKEEGISLSQLPLLL